MLFRDIAKINFSLVKTTFGEDAESESKQFTKPEEMEPFGELSRKVTEKDTKAVGSPLFRDADLQLLQNVTKPLGL